MSLARQTTRWHVARWGTLGWIETGVKSLAFLCASKLVDARTPVWCGTCQQVSTPGFPHNQAIFRCMELSGFEPLTSWVPIQGPGFAYRRGSSLTFPKIADYSRFGGS